MLYNAYIILLSNQMRADTYLGEILWEDPVDVDSLTALPDSGFFSWGLVGRLCDIPFPGALGALTSLGSFPFLVPDVSRRHVRGSRGGWSRHHCHN